MSEAPPPAGAPEPPAKAAAAVGEEDALVEPETLVSGEGVTDDVFSEAGDEIPDSDDNDETDGDLLPSDSEDTHS